MNAAHVTFEMVFLSSLNIPTEKLSKMEKRQSRRETVRRHFLAPFLIFFSWGSSITGMLQGLVTEALTTKIFLISVFSAHTKIRFFRVDGWDFEENKKKMNKKFFVQISESQPPKNTNLNLFSVSVVQSKKSSFE